MKYIFSTQQTEAISVQVESSPIWEVILGITGYTHTQLRHTFDFDEQWSTARTSMPDSLISSLKHIEETNFWYGLLMLQNELSATSVQDFSNRLLHIPVERFYDILLPYHSRNTEAMRIQIATNYQRADTFHEYAKHFTHHPFLGDYIHHLVRYSHEELCDIFTQTLNEWFNWISKQEEWEKWIRALTSEQNRYRSLEQTSPLEEIHRITGGIQYQPEPSIWNVKLIPHISYRPWILEQRTCDTKLFFYPLSEDYLLEPGIPPMKLVRGHKALGDELRLKLLYHLLKGPLSLQELGTHFNITKTTLHHQLSLLKAAKFVKVEKGIYSANPSEIAHFSNRLSEYLGDHI
jgi:DNA-binding transcriptional ArsR family regulator